VVKQLGGRQGIFGGNRPEKLGIGTTALGPCGKLDRISFPTSKIHKISNYDSSLHDRALVLASGGVRVSWVAVVVL
jgi:hypothetical protein